MNCSESNDYMMRYFDGNQNDIENAQLKQHLKSCNRCSEYLDSLKEIFCVIETDNAIEPPPDFEINIMKRIDALELTRKKRADGILIFIYSFVTVILTAVAVAFMARINGINLFDLFNTTEDVFSSFPDTIFTLYSILSAAYNILTRIAQALIQVVSILSSTYYFMIAMLLILFVMLPRVFTGLAKQGGRDEK